MTDTRSTAVTRTPATQVPEKDRAEAVAEKLLALAKSPEERAFAFQALDRYRQSKLIREASDLVAGTKWGRELSVAGRAALARYALTTGTDPVRHWMILGDKLYDTAELWLDLVTSQPDFNGYEPEDLSWTEGLTDEERMRRRQERARHGLPQDVKGACVVRIYKKGIDRPFIGANHAGNRKTFLANKGAVGDKPDPIGEQDPAKTAFTRAFRRAAKTAWPIWPYRRLPMPTDEGVSVVELPPGSVERTEGKLAVEEVVQQGREARQPEPPPAQVSNPSDPYVSEQEARVREEERREAAREQRSA
jgi:hypothetical protein